MNKITITESNGTYELENDGISDFALIGVLECVLHDLKNNRVPSQENSVKTEIKPVEEPAAPITEPVVEEMKVEVPKLEDIKTQATVVPDIRTRITNAIKAIRSLGGQIEEIDLDKSTEEELQTELEALTEQYKRLKGRTKK